MARRYDHTPDELKQMFIDAGKSLIESEGLRQFSARKIAKNIGYSIGTVYHLFGNYDNLVLHINATVLDEMKDIINECIAENVEGSQTIKNIASNYASYADKNYHRWHALYEFSLPDDTPIPDWFSQKITDLFSIVEISLQPFFQNDTHLANHTAKILWASVHGICHLGLSGKLQGVGSASIQVLCDDLIDHYLGHH